MKEITSIQNFFKWDYMWLLLILLSVEFVCDGVVVVVVVGEWVYW